MAGAKSNTILLATRNAHKVGEIRSILGGRFGYMTLNDFPGAPNVEEDANTFEGNATLKATALARWVAGNWRGDRGEGDLLVLADDSGLEVDALNGAPGVHSARFAALDTGVPGNSPDAENNAKLLRLLASTPDDKRTARFRCVIALSPLPEVPCDSSSPTCLADESELGTRLFQGTCEGRITREPSGAGGFGYDPLFVPRGFEVSFAELGEAVKNTISHRAKALEALKRGLGPDDLVAGRS